MTLPLIFTNLANGAKALGKTALQLGRKNAPGLMMGAGVAGFGLTIYETVKATNETNEILERKEKKMELIQKESAENEDYTADIREMDEKNLARDTRFELFKAWIKAAIAAGFTVISFCGAYKLVNGRYVAVSAAYEGLDQFTKRYRRNVIDEYGRDVDYRMAHSIKAEEFEAARKEREENKKIRERNETKKIKKKPRTKYQEINNQIFDIRSSSRWQRWWLPEQMLDFLRDCERKIYDFAQEHDGIVLGNDANDILGLQRTQQGAVLGWVIRPGNNHNTKGHYISLGLANDETPEEEIRRILATRDNEELFFWLMPNYDGVVHNLIGTNYRDR